MFAGRFPHLRGSHAFLLAALLLGALSARHVRAAETAAQPAVSGGAAAAGETSDQPAASSSGPSAQAAAKESQPKPAVARRGVRLPAYYASVVTDEQKQQVLAVVEDFQTAAAPLRKQLAELAAQREAKLRAILTEEQQAKLERLRQEAKEKRGQAAAADNTPVAAPTASPQKAAETGASG